MEVGSGEADDVSVGLDDNDDMCRPTLLLPTRCEDCNVTVGARNELQHATAAAMMVKRNMV